MNLVDTHAHLEDVENLDEALERAGAAGVIAVITMGSDYESNVWALEEGIKHQSEKLKIYPSIGLHPWRLDLSRIDANIRFIEGNIGESVALGEIGLDYWYKEVRKDPEKREQQRELFRRLLEIANRNSKPASIHSRGAWADCADITIEAGVRRAVFHWFSGPLDILEKILDQGYFISATPAAAYSKEHRNAVEKTPLKNLLLETDSPVEYQGVESEPSHLLKTLTAVAHLKGEKIEAVAEKTTSNARLVFDI